MSKITILLFHPSPANPPRLRTRKPFNFIIPNILLPTPTPKPTSNQPIFLPEITKTSNLHSCIFILRQRILAASFYHFFLNFLFLGKWSIFKQIPLPSCIKFSSPRGMLLRK
ncbi:hypothetical protein CDAR_114771 [Caerostris darwini]|uniref:Uncharacterized protein n=1 Tax=Caerostris darwini TaxID=1538125 RepID=A0AAV4MIS4_9ARAC|nr:hypothetical protein CDAR_114771 [Caerostris darwini]